MEKRITTAKANPLINKCETLAELDALIKKHNFGKDDRKTIINSLADTRRRLTGDGPEDKPAEDKPAEDKPADDKPAEDKPAEDKPAEDKPADDKPTPTPKPSDGVEKSPKEIKALARQEKISAFRKKIPARCRVASIIEFAGTYFGEELVSAKLKSNSRVAVEIKLKSPKTSFDVYGL